MSPATAERLGLGYTVGSHGGEHGETLTEVVELRYQGRLVRAPVWIMPGHADHSVTVYLGYGRTRAGRVGTGTGFNAYALRTSDAPWFGAGLEIRKTGEQYPLACTQLHHNMEGRDLVRSATLAHYQEHPDSAHGEGHGAGAHLSLYPEDEYPGYAWGMAIDLTSCIGCNGCVVACQAENNIPIVGKGEVLRGREMHWLRIDRYYTGDLDNPETYHQPVLCMHCEKAPCELVCPVNATVHSAEGLNDMVYNRCVGTRYCSNNCPYKVRRFNFLQYSDWETPSLKLLRNPDVTVRSRGVMEKCTYCVQRINHARIEAEKDGRRIRDGEVVTACQAACPAQAIVFGDINDPNSRVAQLKAEPRNYGLLAELNTQPRTTYLAAVRNPNPEIETE
ncbi:MAG: 4Fe-4S dicluster domain-containing protein, partial [Candidatus Binatia bacterium]